MIRIFFVLFQQFIFAKASGPFDWFTLYDTRTTTDLDILNNNIPKYKDDWGNYR